MKNMLITIITVCKNAEEVINDTLESVFSQTYPFIEYIIIDGGSTDNTLNIIKRAAQQFQIKYVSEPDKGIYDAMNKGIGLATGDYIYFLNAGDTLVENDIINKVVDKVTGKSDGIFYGNVVYKYPNGNRIIRVYGKICGKKIYYYTGDCINHQAVFAASKYLKENKFDISYKICGDREWMMRMHKAKVSFNSMALTICNYSLAENSISLSNDEVSHQEAARCMKEYFCFGYGIFLIFEACRKSKLLSGVLHKVYKLLYIQKEK